MPLDAKQKKQVTIILVLLVGFVFYEMNEMKKKRQRALLAVSSAPKVASATSPTKEPSPPSSSPQTSATTVVTEASTAPSSGDTPVKAKKITQEEKMLYFKRQEGLIRKGWGHDPFYPEALPEATKEENPTPPINPTERPQQGLEPSGTETAIKLTGISKIGKNFYATINRKMLQEGDSVSGYRVIRIQDESVTVQKDQRSYELRLGK